MKKLVGIVLLGGVFILTGCSGDANHQKAKQSSPIESTQISISSTTSISSETSETSLSTSIPSTEASVSVDSSISITESSTTSSSTPDLTTSEWLLQYVSDAYPLDGYYYTVNSEGWNSSRNLENFELIVHPLSVETDDVGTAINKFDTSFWSPMVEDQNLLSREINIHLVQYADINGNIITHLMKNLNQYHDSNF